MIYYTLLGPASDRMHVRLTVEEKTILRYAMQSYKDIFAGKIPLKWEYEWKDSEEGRVLSKIKKDEEIDLLDKEKWNEFTRRLIVRDDNEKLHRKIIRDFIRVLESNDKNEDNRTPLFQLIENDEGNVRLINITPRETYHDKTMMREHLEYIRMMCLLLLEGKESEDDMRKFRDFFTNLQEQIDQGKINQGKINHHMDLTEDSEEIPVDHDEENEKEGKEKRTFSRPNIYIIGMILFLLILLVFLSMYTIVR